MRWPPAPPPAVPAQRPGHKRYAARFKTPFWPGSRAKILRPLRGLRPRGPCLRPLRRLRPCPRAAAPPVARVPAAPPGFFGPPGSKKGAAACAPASGRRLRPSPRSRVPWGRAALWSGSASRWAAGLALPPLRVPPRGPPSAPGPPLPVPPGAPAARPFGPALAPPAGGRPRGGAGLWPASFGGSRRAAGPGSL